MKPVVIGIAGGSSSGKTTLVQALAAALGGDIPVFCHDHYYRVHPELRDTERCALNYDEPAALETELLVRHLDQLLAGQTAEQPTYDFSLHTRRAETLPMKTAPVILVEGILIFCDQALRERMDLRVFVDAPEETRLRRRLARDTAERGRTREAVLAQYESTVRPMHAQYVEPGRQYAHLTVPGDGEIGQSVAAILHCLPEHCKAL